MKNPILLILVCLISQVVAGKNGWIEETVTHTINTNFSEALKIVEQKLEADSNNYRAQFLGAPDLPPS